MVKLAKAIRDAAGDEGLERFRRKHGLPNTSFYALLRGELPAKVATRERMHQALRAAGVGLALEEDRPANRKRRRKS